MAHRIEIALQPKQTLFDKTIEQTENVFYGGAKGGGKSHGLRSIMLKRRFQYPGTRGVIFRKTYPELYNNHITRLLNEYPALSPYYNRQHKELQLPNGSVLMFRHCQYEKDLALHQGVEYEDLGIDEVGEWPEDWYWTLKGSNRTSQRTIKPRFMGTGNPGGVGHKWLKRIFIERQFRDVERPNDYAFVPATVYDNAALMRNDPGYIDRLKANKNPMLVKAYLEGSWDIMAGQFFDMVSREAHFVEPFPIPEYWQRIGGFDTGYNHPAVFLWGASDTDGNVYIYREYAKSGRRSEEIGRDIFEYPDSVKLPPVASGLDCWAKHGGGPSVQEKISDATGHRIVLQKAKVDRVAGAQQVRDYLVVRENGPRLKIFKTCPILFDCLTRMTHDLKNPEDVLKVDAIDGDPYTGDDAYDALRYLLMNRPKISIDEAAKPRKRRRYHDKHEPAGSWETV